MNARQDIDQPATGTPQEVLTRLAANKARWVAMPPANKLCFLEQMLRTLRSLDHDSWGACSAARQGYDVATDSGASLGALEGMVNAVILATTLRALRRTYTALAANGALPDLPHRWHHGRRVVPVFPHVLLDKLSLEGMAGLTAEVWLREGAAGASSALPQHDGRVTVVLGAGNQSFLAIADVLHQMFVEGSVCVLKHHPLRDFSAPFVDELFAELSAEGFFFACTGGVDVAQALLACDGVDHVHMTGGTENHDAIVWGADPELRAQRKAARTPVLQASMTSELGCATPWFITPGGDWTTAQLRHVAGQLATAFAAQNSCNCLSPQVLVLDAGWTQRDAFLEHLRDILAVQPLVPPHYPGVRDRYAAFVDAYPDACLERIQAPVHRGMNEDVHGPALPWLLIHLDPSLPTLALEQEAFGPVLAIHSMDTGGDPERFLQEAVAWANQSVWGTLSCSLFVHPDIQTRLDRRVEQAIEALRYGCVGLNTWTTTGYALPGATWGAYPGEPLHDVASGIGVVRNVHMLRGVEKTVVRAPFKNLAQMVSPPNGRDLLSAPQARSIRDMLLRPGLGPMLKLGYHMLLSSPG